MSLGMEVGLGPGHILRDGDPAPPQKRGAQLQFSAHVYCGQTASWIKMPIATEVGLGPYDIVLDEAQLPQMGHAPKFSTHVYCGQTVVHLSCC